MGLLDDLRYIVGNTFRAPKDETPLEPTPKSDGSVLGGYQKVLKDFESTPYGRAYAADASTTAMRCIDFRCNQILDMKWSIKNAKGEVVKLRAFDNMLSWHYKQSGENLFKRWLTQLLVHGNVWFLKLYRPNTEIPGGIAVLNSMYCEPHIERSAWQYLQYDPPGANKNYQVNPDFLLWDKLPSLQSDWRGKSPMDRAMEWINLDRKNIHTIRAYLNNDNKPSAILTLDPNAPNYSEEELDEFIEMWNKQGMGSHQGYKTKVLPAAFNLHAFATQRPDMLISYNMASMICQEFKLDPNLVGVYDQTDSNNQQINDSMMQIKKVAALSDAIKPDMRHIEQFINEKILPFIAPHRSGYKFSWNYEHIDRITLLSDKYKDQLRSDVLSGLITVKQFLEAQYYPTDDNDNYRIHPKGYVRVHEDDKDAIFLTNKADILLALSPDFAKLQMTGGTPTTGEAPGVNRYPVLDAGGMESLP